MLLLIPIERVKIFTKRAITNMLDSTITTARTANIWDKIFTLLLVINLIFIFYNFSKVEEQTDRLADAQIQTTKILESRTVYFDELKTILANQSKILSRQQELIDKK